MILSAGIIIGRHIEGQWLYLFLRAYNYWDFPKGQAKEGETPLETAIREVREETGQNNLSFPWGEIFKETEPYREGKKIARYYLAETSDPTVKFSINPSIGKPEHHEYRWLAANDLKLLAAPRLYPVIDWAREIIEGH